MLVCQCNIISDREIKRVVLDLLRADPWQLIVPAVVYRELAKRCKCAGCVPNVVDIILEVTEKHHLELAGRPEGVPPAHPKLLALKRKRSGDDDEGRSTGHRAA